MSLAFSGHIKACPLRVLDLSSTRPLRFRQAALIMFSLRSSYRELQGSSKSICLGPSSAEEKLDVSMCPLLVWLQRNAVQKAHTHGRCTIVERFCDAHAGARMFERKAVLLDGRLRQAMTKIKIKKGWTTSVKRSNCSKGVA